MWGRLEIPLAIAGCVSQSERQPRRVESQLPYLVAQFSRQLQQRTRIIQSSIVVCHPYRPDGGLAGFIVPAVPATLGRDKVVFVLDHHLGEGLPCIGIEGRGRHRDMGIGRLDNALVVVSAKQVPDLPSRDTILVAWQSRLSHLPSPPSWDGYSTLLSRLSQYCQNASRPPNIPQLVPRSWLQVSRPTPRSTICAIRMSRQ
jgi:hypothetical protein